MKKNTSNERKLCLAIPSLQVGGMERVMSVLANFFCHKRDLQVHLVLYGKKPELFYMVPTILVVHKPDNQFNDRMRLLSSIERLLFIRRTIRRINPDSILSFGEYWNSFVLIALYGMQYHIYISDRAQPDKRLNKYHDLLRKCLYPRAAGIIAQTEKANMIYQKWGINSNIKTIGNPISLTKDLHSYSIRENIILSVGRLIKTKNYDKLIELFVTLGKPGWRLIIVGNDAQKQHQKRKLEALIRNLNAEEIVFLVGNHSDIKQFYSKSAIFAFASESEGFPNVIGEAQSYGLPVIAFDCIAGPSDLVFDNVNGYLIPLNDYDMFRRKLEILMSNTELR